jgi:general secretion pathway protein L
MDGTIRTALAPLLRELRQTIASFRSRDKTPLDSVLLTGGSAALPGLPEHLEEELGLPVALYAPETGAPVADLPEGEAAQGRYALAAAVAWAGARGGKEIDLRRGPFQYRASFSVVRQKAAHLGALAAALLVCAVLNGSMALARLNKQKDQLQAQLKSATQELFGAPRMDAKAVSTLLKKGFRDEMAPIPKATAFDLLGEISRKLPPGDQIKLDITELDIKPKKTTIRGTVDSAAAVDEMVSRLKQIECFDGDISKGAITEVSDGAKQFLLTINSKCP